MCYYLGMNNIINQTVTRSNLMRAFNLARRARCFEPKRLNRAWGIVQRNSTMLLADGRLDSTGSDWHLTTVAKCDCEDHKHTKYCKHIIAAMLIKKATILK